LLTVFFSLRRISDTVSALNPCFLELTTDFQVFGFHEHELTASALFTQNCYRLLRYPWSSCDVGREHSDYDALVEIPSFTRCVAERGVLIFSAALIF
jgi:hypothetical protein